MKSQGDNITGTSPIDFSKPLDTSVVKGKTALVQDGAAGLGSGIAKALAENGARVAICDKRAKEGEAFAKDLNGKGYDVKYIQAETGDWASSLAGFKQALEWSEDQLDIVVLSPGIVTNNLLLSILPKHRGPDEDPAEPPTNVLQIDLVGVYYATSLALFYFNKLYAKRKDPEFEPQIVFICSMAGVSAQCCKFVFIYVLTPYLSNSTMGSTSEPTTQQPNTAYEQSSRPQEDPDPVWRSTKRICSHPHMSKRTRYQRMRKS